MLSRVVVCVLVLVALLGGAPAPSCADDLPVLARLAERVDGPGDQPRALFTRDLRLSSVRVQASRARVRPIARCEGVVPVAAPARRAAVEHDAADHLRLAGAARVRPSRGPPAS